MPNLCACLGCAWHASAPRRRSTNVYAGQSKRETTHHILASPTEQKRATELRDRSLQAHNHRSAIESQLSHACDRWTQHAQEGQACGCTTGNALHEKNSSAIARALSTQPNGICAQIKLAIHTLQISSAKELGLLSLVLSREGADLQGQRQSAGTTAPTLPREPVTREHPMRWCERRSHNA